MPEVDMAAMFLLGLLGTGHCVGMCGPLVLALPGASGRFGPQIAYHLGRILTYAAVGGIVAGLGALLRSAGGGEDPAGVVARAQVAISIVAALLLVVLGLARLGIIGEPRLLAVASPSRMPGFRLLERGASPDGGTFRTFFLGMLLGLLPCGLSYAAFARALPLAEPLQGVLYLAAFGAGTAPGLFLLGTGGAAFARRHARLSDVLAGVLLVGMAASLAVDAARALT